VTWKQRQLPRLGRLDRVLVLWIFSAVLVQMLPLLLLVLLLLVLLLLVLTALFKIQAELVVFHLLGALTLMLVVKSLLFVLLFFSCLCFCVFALQLKLLRFNINCTAWIRKLLLVLDNVVVIVVVVVVMIVKGY
jgi:hypothetical protein